MTTRHRARIEPRTTRRGATDASRVRITLRGDLPDTVLVWATRTLHRLLAADRQLVAVHITVTHRHDPTRPYRADLTADFDDHLLHARADAENAADALALAGDRLQDQITGRKSPAAQPARPYSELTR